MAGPSRWKGLVALVTGGTSGIGEATARLLIKEGMKVIVCARNQDKLNKLDDELNTDPSNRCFLAVQCDISKEDQVLKMFQQIRSEFGQLNICINNAGLNKKNATLLEGSTEAWQGIMDPIFYTELKWKNAALLEGSKEEWKAITDINVIGLSICTREAVKLMREKGIGDGHIIHVCSIMGHYILRGSDWSMYQASKHAVKALTECLRLDLRAQKSNIKVSSVSPAHVHTDFAKEVVEDVAARNAALPGVTGEEVAGVIWCCINQPQNVQIHDVIVRATQEI